MPLFSATDRRAKGGTSARTPANPGRARADATWQNHGTCRLPGVLPGLRLSGTQDADAVVYAMVSTTTGRRHTVHFTAVGGEEWHGDGHEADQLLARWRKSLRGLRDPTLLAAGLTLEMRTPRVLRLSLTYSDQQVDRKPDGRGKSRNRLHRMAAHLHNALPKARKLLMEVSPTAVPMSAQDLTYHVRKTFDPSIIDLVAGGAPLPVLRWKDVPPSRVREAWDHVVHDGATSITWAMCGVAGESITPFLATPNPLANGRIHVELRRPDASARDSDFAPIMLCTATSIEPTDKATPTLENFVAGLPQSTRWNLRRVYGGQAAAFTAGAGLGVDVPRQLLPPRGAKK
ncbi:hypothetical protein OG216_46240 (plasmid) [Streptomycetaceae bacterium NBC_01309]